MICAQKLTQEEFRDWAEDMSPSFSTSIFHLIWGKIGATLGPSLSDPVRPL